jgi:hypothetical protein
MGEITVTVGPRESRINCHNDSDHYLFFSFFCPPHVEQKYVSTKQELPNDVLKASKYISDLTKQTSKVGELRGAIQAGVMTEQDVYAELGELVNGKPGRVGDELIVVDLTGTGAQDAAIGQVRS